MIVGVAITLVSSIIPARHGARMPPIAAMRDVAIERPIARGRRLAIGLVITALGLAALMDGLFRGAGISLVGIGAVCIFAGAFVLGPLYARATGMILGAPIARVRGITGEIARENVGRNPRRTATTSAALMIGVALIAFIAIFAASAKVSFGSAIDSQIKADYVINSGGSFGGTGLSPQLGRQVARLPVIATSTPLRVGQIGVRGNLQFVGAFDPSAARLFDLNIVAGNLSELTPDGLVVSKKTADNHHLTVGTVIPVTFVKTGVQPMKVEAIYGVSNLALPTNYLMSIAGYEKNFAQQLDVLIYAKLKPGVSAKHGQAAITPLLANYPTAKLQDLASYKADQMKNLNQLLALVYGLLFFAVIIAFIGVVNTLALSVHERTHEIGLLRAVGMSRRQVRSAMRWESVLIALLGTFMGLVVGLFLGWACVRALRDSGLNHFSPATPTLIVLVIVAAVLGVVSAILPARRAARLDILRAIATE
jgi:putative ABC transport system permease protein